MVDPQGRQAGEHSAQPILCLVEAVLTLNRGKLGHLAGLGAAAPHGMNLVELDEMGRGAQLAGPPAPCSPADRLRCVGNHAVFARRTVVPRSCSAVTISSAFASRSRARISTVMLAWTGHPARNKCSPPWDLVTVT